MERTGTDGKQGDRGLTPRIGARAQSFRVAFRRFDPFEAALKAGWEDFAAASGCGLRLEAQAFEVQDLHAELFGRGGLRSGEWDAALVVTDWLAEARASGALADLRGSEDGDRAMREAWPESLLRHQRFGNEVLGLPFHDGPECLVYRTDLAAAPPRTWDEFRSMARRQADPGQGRWGALLAGFPDGHNSVYDFCLQLWTRGGELFDAAGRPRLESAAAAATLEFHRSFLREQPAAHPACRRLDSVNAGLAFARGEAAMMVNWFGFAVMAQTHAESRVRGKVSVAPLPAGQGGAPATLNVYWVLAAAAGSPHPREAAQYVRHCTDAAGDKRLMLRGGVGCRRSTWNDPDVRAALPFSPLLESLHAGARELPRIADWDRLAGIIDRAVTAAVETDAPIAQILAEAQKWSASPPTRMA